MSDLRKQFERVVARTNKRLIQQHQILPVKTVDGILVGCVIIKARDTLKDLWLEKQLVYEGVYLNKAAIKLANILAIFKHTTAQSEQIYKADQDYGRLFVESQLLRSKLHYARQQGDFDRADIYLARYTVYKDRLESAKRQVIALAGP
jgi:hypothetical protein